MTTELRIMVLDGDQSHSLAVSRELKQWLNCTIYAVGVNERSHSHRSRHTDLALEAPLPDEASYAEEVVSLVRKYSPDAVIPIGFTSHKKMLAIEHEFPSDTILVAPELEAFTIATSKSITYEKAINVGVRVPQEHNKEELLLEEPPSGTKFPVFAKARMERGGVSTALINDARALREFDEEELGGDVIYQEFIDGDPYTYAHCAYYTEGKPLVQYQHIELRSVPRRGGSGTRLRVTSNPEVAESANRLMSHLNWSGHAQIEFKRNKNQELVLMEINPKLWASYAIANAAGYPIVATEVIDRLAIVRGLPSAKRKHGFNMVFPIRELLFLRKSRKITDFVSSFFSMLFPPARTDIELRDLRAHIPLKQR